MAKTALSTITTMAKRIRKQSPRMTWQAAIKKAGLEYRRQHATKRKVGAYKVVEKAEPRSAKVTKVYRTERTKKGTFKGYSVAGLRSELKKQLALEIGMLEARKLDAKTIRDRNAIQKVIALKRREYRKFS